MAYSVVDSIADINGSRLVGLLQQFSIELPEYVKEAEQREIIGVDKTNIAPNAFADTLRKVFPCHTKSACWASCLHFYGHDHKLPQSVRDRIESNLEKMATYWSILPDLQYLKEKIVQVKKEAKANLPESAYLYVYKDESTPARGYCPLTSEEEIKQAAEWLQSNRDDFTLRDRVKMANKLLDAADHKQFSVPQRPEIEKLAGRAIGKIADIKQAFEFRLAAVKTAEARETFQGLIDSLDDVKDVHLDPDTALKLAETMDQMDQAFELTGGYGQALKRPEDVVFALPFSKMAQAMEEHITLTTGDTFRTEDLAKVGAETLTDLFGAEVAQQIVDDMGAVTGKISPAKVAEFAQTLPRPDAAAFVDAVARDGVKPVHQKSAGLDWDELANAL